MPMTDELQLRKEICRVGRSLFERGYMHATAGNISVRLADGFLITPTDACLGFLEPEGLAKVSLNGMQQSGDQASKALALHRSIYDADPAASCVIHSHSTNLVALTFQRLESRRYSSALHSILRDEGGPCAAYRISSARRPGGGRSCGAGCEENAGQGLFNSCRHA